MVSNPSNKVKTEAINGVILRLLGLNPGVELDYQTYNDIIKKKLLISNIAGGSLPREEEDILREELKRVRRIKDKGLRFKIKTSKAKVSAGVAPGPGVSPSGSGGPPKSGAIVKAKTAKIIPQKIIPVNVKDVTEKKEEKVGGFDQIKKTLNSILGVLASKFKFDKKQSDQERKEKETEKRGKREAGLEGFRRGISAISGATKKLLAPFQSIIDRIWKFIFFTLLGRAFTKFMEWMNDKGNQEKFNSFIEFLSDHFPALVGLYVLFGTSFGKLVRGLLKGATRMIVALAMNIPKIFAFIRKNKKLAFLALAAAPLVSREIGNLFTDKETPESGLIPTKNPELDQAKQSADQATNAKVPTFNVGGMIPKFNLGGMLPSFAMGSMNPFGGMDFQSGVPITGAKGDDTLIAAKTGEAILTEKDQKDIGQRYVDKTTGQPLNIPQYLSGRKPGKVSLSKIGFPGFSNGGVIQAFNTGGIIGMQGGGNITPESLEKTYISGQKSGMNPDALKAIGDEAFLLRNFGAGGTWKNFRGSGASNMRGEPLPIQKKQGGGVIGMQGGGGVLGGIVGGVKNLWNNATSSFRPKPQKMGPALTPEITRGVLRREPKQLTRSAKSLVDQRWSASSVGVDPSVGCAAAIKEVYRRSGINLPWSNSANPNYVPDIHSFLDKKFSKVSENQRKPGDIVIWKDTGYPPGSGNEPYGHIGIVMSDGRIANNSSSKGTFTNLNTPQEAKSWWPNTQQLLYFRDPRISQLSSASAKGKGKTSKTTSISSQMLFGNLMNSVGIKKQGGGPIGGLIKENTGINIPGATADRQLVASQPGEYWIPKDTVDRLGVSFFDKLVAATDSNSNPAKLGVRSKNVPNITPLSRRGGDMMTLPPIIQSASGMGNVGNSSGAGSRAPVFSTVSASGARQIAETASILGIVG